MAKRELGAKHVCPECYTRFYDFERQPPLCPKCGAAPSIPATAPPEPKEEGPPPETAEPRRDLAEDQPKQMDADDVPALTVADLTDGDDDGDEVLKPVQGGEADDGVIEDASDLGEDEDDMSEAREHVDEAVVDQN